MACMGASESLRMGARADTALLRWQGFLAWSVVALAPALFMYIRHLLSAAPWPRWQVALHFVPALVVGLPVLGLSLTQTDPAFWREHAQVGADAGVGTGGAISALLALQWAAYGVAAWLLLQHYRRRLLQQYSNVDQRRMGWLGTLIACLPALLLLWLLARLGGPEVALLIDTLYVPVGVAVLATFALRQPAVLLEPIDPHPPAPSRPPPVPPHLQQGRGVIAPVAPPAPPAAGRGAARPADAAPADRAHDPPARADASQHASRPGFGASVQAPQAGAEALPERTEPAAALPVEQDRSTDDAERMIAPAPEHGAAPALPSAEDDARWAALQVRLDELLAIERPYLDNDLSLAALAQMLQTSTHHLSYVLNQRLGVSFYDLINERRVREVQRCLRDPAYAGQSILEIALDAGFSSKATFNAAFKKHAGTTPSAYRQQLAGSSQA
jgi:AraC-like DNA-binding protein